MLLRKLRALAFLLALLPALWSGLALAQTYPTLNPTYFPNPVQGPLTCASTAAPCTYIFVMNGVGDVLISVSGTYTALVATVAESAQRQATAIWTQVAAKPEGSAAGSGLVQTIAANGIYRIKGAGTAQLRLQVASMGSGSAVFSIVGGAGVSSWEEVSPLTRNTYSATIAALSPAASATDVMLLNGNASTVVRVWRIECSGTATANGIDTLYLVKRSAANTGTSAAATVVPNDANSPAALSAPVSYTANPTPGAAIGNVRAVELALYNATTTTIAPAPIVWTFGDRNEQPILLRGVAQGLAINNNGASFPAGASLTCDFQWSEE